MNKARHHPDYLGLRSGLDDRLLPLLVAAMSFLAVLALAGALASAALAVHWQGDTESALTVQVPQPGDATPTGQGTRLAAVMTALQTAPGVSAVTLLGPEEVNRLLTPWLGGDAGALGLTLPAVVSARWDGDAPDALTVTLDKAAPGTLVQSGAEWAARVAALTTSVQTCAVAVLVIVTLIAIALVAVATRSGLAQRRDAVTLVHGLGALDADIARRFAARTTALAAAGSGLGVLVALPVLGWLASLAAPLAGGSPQGALYHLPPALWVALPVLPLVAALIGWGATQYTVRGWLRNLP